MGALNARWSLVSIMGAASGPRFPIESCLSLPSQKRGKSRLMRIALMLSLFITTCRAEDDLLQCRPGCLHNGTCILDRRTKIPFCLCPDPDPETNLFFRGSSCQTQAIRCSSSWWCENGGQCQPLPSQLGFQCSCPLEFKGSKCQSPVSQCSNGLWCANGGVCEFRPEANATICRCPSTHSGDSCETMVEPQELAPTIVTRSNFSSPVVDVGAPGGGPVGEVKDERQGFVRLFILLLLLLLLLWLLAMCIAARGRRGRRSRSSNGGDRIHGGIVIEASPRGASDGSSCSPLTTPNQRQPGVQSGRKGSVSPFRGGNPGLSLVLSEESSDFEEGPHNKTSLEEGTSSVAPLALLTPQHSFQMHEPLQMHDSLQILEPTQMHDMHQEGASLELVAQIDLGPARIEVEEEERTKDRRERQGGGWREEVLGEEEVEEEERQRLQQGPKS